MSVKRYFKIEYDEEWYLFDSTTISKQLVEEQAEYGYGVFANSLSPSEIEKLLNEYETVLNDTQTFTLNLCKFLMEKGLDDEFREKYGDESLNFKMSNAIYGYKNKVRKDQD